MRKTTLGSLKRRGVSAALLVAVGALGFSAVAAADTVGLINFESYDTTSSINGQQGWSKTGGYDVEVEDTTRFGFGKALRISNAVTSSDFGTHAFSPGLADPAGETAQKHFEASFDIATTSDAVQPNLAISVSPDPGNGGRMSYLRFADTTDGVKVFFNDVTNPGPIGTVSDFNDREIATLARTSAHKIKFSIDFVPGHANDVVRVYVDGTLKQTGTSWEDYYRFDPEQAGNQNVVPGVSKMLFRTGGTAVPANLGNGFLIDNMTLTSASTAPCEFSVTGTTMALVSSCTTTTPIVVPAGYTLDGAGKTITAAPGGLFDGGIVANTSGQSMTVKNLNIVGRNLGLSCGVNLAGVRLVGAGGTIDNVNINGLYQTEGNHISGCQVGHGIEVDARGVASPVTVTIKDSEIVDYQKTGLLVRGNVHATITGNIVDGFGKDPFATTYIASNGIQISYGASAVINTNEIKDNYYTPKSYSSAGLITYKANGITTGLANSKKDIFVANTFSGNEENMIGGRGGNPA